MAKIDNIPVIANPYLVDRVIADIQTGLKANLDWLDYAFGKAQRLTTVINGKKIVTPNVYAGGNEYVGVSPDKKIGNFSFFTIDDPQNMDRQPNIPGELKVVYSLIFWFDIRTITGADNRNMEFVKSEILKTLNGKFRIQAGRINVKKIYELNENIYRGFNLEEIDNQYLQHPYGGFRFTGDMGIDETCYNG